MRQIPFYSLSLQDKYKAYKNEKVTVRFLKQKYSRLIAKLEAKSRPLIFNNRSSVKTIIDTAFNIFKKDWANTADEIMAMMLEYEFEDNVKDGVDLDEKKKCAVYITECTRNMTLHLNDGSR